MDFDTHYRLKFEEMNAYTNDVLNAKEKYKKDIQILLGYEVDYLKGYMDKRVLESEVDYLIGSVHFIDKWGFDNPEFIGGWKEKSIDEIWKAYFEAIENMAKTGYFDIVGHFDLIKVFKFMPSQDIRLLARPALKAIKKANMVLEINTAGFRKPIGELYPSPLLLEEAYSLDIPICFSSDAHAVEQVGFKYEEAITIAKKIGYSEAMSFKEREWVVISF
jgi:histidinol-phosphatase (PHP family)